MYTIHAEVMGEVFPLVFALLPNRTIRTYKALFRAIKTSIASAGFTLALQNLQIDYEQSVISAAQEVFEGKLPTTTNKVKITKSK